MAAILRGRRFFYGISFFAKAWDTLNMPQRQRHLRQITLPWCGEEGQSRIRGAHVLVVGCGALGCASIEWLAEEMQKVTAGLGLPPGLGL